MEGFIDALGDEVEDADEETFDLFSQTLPLENLGMMEATAEEFDVSIGDREFTLRQSMGSLHSQRKDGTTGAAVWKVSARVAEWLGSSLSSSSSSTATSTNVLFKHGILQPTASVLELGSGVSGLVPLTLGPRVGEVIATDQPYTLKLLQKNISTNDRTASSTKGTPAQHKKDSSARHAVKGRDSTSSNNNIRVLPLDWETDDIPSFLATHGLPQGVDALIATDTIYNYALLAPFTQACIDICAARERYRRGKKASTLSAVGGEDEVPHPTVCVIAQQLRQSEVFAQWLEMQLAGGFRVWRVPEEMLINGLRVKDGFAVHILLLLHHREDGMK